MNTKKMKHIIKFLINSNKETGLNSIPLFWGNTGIGKTEVTKQVLKEMGYKMTYVTVGNMEDVGDLTGMPMIAENGEMLYAKPDWFPKESKTVIFLDEINRCKPQIKQALVTFLNQKRILNNVLPEDCHFVAAANPPTDDFEVSNITDKAFLNRFLHFEYNPESSEWVNYTAQQNGDLAFIQFVSENSKYLETKVKDFKISDFVIPTRRNLTAYSIILKSSPPPDIKKEIGYSLIGRVMTEQFIAQENDYRKTLLGSAILKDFKKEHEVVIKSLHNNTDILNKIIEDVVSNIKKAWVDTYYGNLLKFISFLPKDLIVKFLYDLCEINEDLATKIGDDPDLIQDMKGKV